MKQKIILLCIVVLLSSNTFSVNAQNSNYRMHGNQEFSEELTYYEGTAFIATHVLDTTSIPTSFNIPYVTTSKSNELALMVYNCASQNKSGFLLVFYGSYWNENGVLFTGYGFRNLEKEQAIIFAYKMDSIITTYTDFLLEKRGSRSIYFNFLDMTFIFSARLDDKSKDVIKTRVIWNGFDSEWTQSSIQGLKGSLIWIK